MSIRSDYKKGMSYVDITKKYNIARRTAKNIVLLKQNQNIHIQNQRKNRRTFQYKNWIYNCSRIRKKCKS